MYINVELIYNNTYKFVQFTYKVPNKYLNKIKIGSIIEIMFRNKKYNAVVVETNVKLSNNIKTKEVKKLLYNLSKKQLDYIKILAISNYLNIGMLLSNIFNLDTFITQDKINNKKYKLMELETLIDNVSDNHKNIFIVSSLEQCMKLNNRLTNASVHIDFFQKTGGTKEVAHILSNELNFKNIIILSNNFNYFKVEKSTIFHFYDTNNISFNLPKLNSMNIVELAVYKNMIFGGNFIFYNKFPALDVFNSIQHINKIDIDNKVTYLYGNNLEECINIFRTKFDRSLIKPFTFSDIIKDNLSDYNFTDNFDEKEINMFLLFNPKISTNKTLNSIRLISLLKQLEFCKNNDIEVIMLSTKEHNFNELLSISNIKKLADKEIQERADYGPNIDIKVFSFATKGEYINDNFKDYILGPKTSNDLFEYEIRLILSNNLNYNKIMSLFSDVSKFEPIKIRNI